MTSASQSSLLVQKQLKDLCKYPVDGFSAGLLDEENLFEWSVTIIGPPDTLYLPRWEGLHSILHPPGDDPNGYELASERWSPVHTKEWREQRDKFKKKKVSRCVRRSQEML